MTKTLAAIFALKNQLTKTGVLCLVSLSLLKPAFASDIYVFDRDHTNITWHAGHFGFSNQSGRFNQVEGSMILDPHSPNRSHVEVTINTASIVTGLGNFDNYLKGVNFLNVETFPTATFISDQIEIKGSQNALIHGKLTLLGITKPVTLETRLNKIGINPFNKKQTAGFSANTIIKRSDFGMNFGTPGISDQVKINIEAEAILSQKATSTTIKSQKNKAEESHKWTVVTDESQIEFQATQFKSNSLAAGNMTIDADQQVIFRSTKSGSEITGKFNKISGTIFFDPKNLNHSSINVAVDTSSVTIDFFDSEIIKGANWLESLKFPQATFTSNTITSLDFNNTEFSTSGMLTIKGRSVPATVNFKLQKYLPSSKEITAYGTLEIQRNSFGIGDNSKEAKDFNNIVVLNFIIKAKK